MKSSTDVVAEGIKHILELSADAHIQRRVVHKDCPAFHNLTGAIAAFGKVLAFLAHTQQEKAFLANSEMSFHKAAAGVGTNIPGCRYKSMRAVQEGR